MTLVERQNSPSLTFIDWENIVKEADQTYDSILDFEQLSNTMKDYFNRHSLRSCGIYAYSDFDQGEAGVQTSLYLNGIHAKHVVTKTAKKELRSNASDIELSLDIMTHLYEDPHIDDFVVFSGDGDLMHVIQRLRLKGKRIHLLCFERSNHLLHELADYITIFDDKATFIRKVSQDQRDKLAQLIRGREDIKMLIYQLNKMEREKEFVSSKFFHKVLTEKFPNLDMDSALTEAKKAGLVLFSTRQNPNDKRNPTSVIMINHENEIAVSIVNEIS